MTNSIEQALVFHRENNFTKAESCYLAILNSSNKDTQDIHYLLGLLYSQNKNYLKAIRHLELALINGKINAEIHHALALCYHKLMHLKPAIIFITIALSLDPNNKNYCNRKSKIHLSGNQLQKSMNHALSCIALHPLFTPAYLSYIQASNQLNRPDNSLRIIKRAYRVKPSDPEILFSLAQAYHNVGNDKKSAPIFLFLYENNYKTFECLNNLGNIEREYGEIDKAQEFYRHANNINPKNSVTLWNLSLLALTQGNYNDGWKNYDQRLPLKTRENIREGIKERKEKNINDWHGESLAHKNILIISEQGLGDEILFSSSFSLIANQAQQVILLCSIQLKPIFKLSFPQITCIDKNERNNHAMEQCHYKVNAGSIFQYIKAPPIVSSYLKANPYLSTHRDKLKIGFSWKGGGKYADVKKRSIQLKKWLPFIGNIKHQTELYCLQHSISDYEKSILSTDSPNIHFLPSSNDITHLINLISTLDIVISVTNTNIHIAGALGIKTLCLTPHNPDWPWGLTGEKCHWYPSVTIIRQENKSWSGIFNRVLPFIKNKV